MTTVTVARRGRRRYYLAMLRRRSFHYLVDGLTADKAAILRRSLAILPEVYAVEVSVGRGTVEVQARRDLADQVRLACSVAEVHYRTRAKL